MGYANGRTVHVSDTGSCAGGRNFTNAAGGKWPASYAKWIGAGVPTASNYTTASNWQEILIKSGSVYSSQRAECQPSGCSFNQEIQNYANWYTYYRSRILTARAGAGRAFSTATGMRLGFATINKENSIVDGQNHSKVALGVREFEGVNKVEWFRKLYTEAWIGSTPLRGAVAGVGSYFQRSDSRSPWAETNHLSVGQPAADHSSCRASYHILMTDGYWNGDGGLSVGNQDGSMGAPFADSVSNTLADVVAQFWKTDLRLDLANNLPTSPKNPASWQHLVHYSIGLGVAPKIVNETQVFQNILTNSAPTPAWPNGATYQIDDLVHAAVNGRGNYFSATNPDEFAAALDNILQQIQSQNIPGRVSRSQVRLDKPNLPSYFSSYNSLPTWHGDLKAHTTDQVTGELSSAPVWSAATKLAARPAANRKIFTWDGSISTGSSVVFDQSISSQWKTDLLAGNTNVAINVSANDLISYIRGDHSKEQFNTGGQLRTRKDSDGNLTVMGDIINSRVATDNKQDFGWSGFPAIPHNNESKYSYYLTQKGNLTTRKPVIYVGANDGMLHAFLGTGDNTGGEELFAYIPKSLRHTLKNLADTDIDHRYYMDGTPALRDARIGSGDKWRTVLLAAPAAGGAGLFALDVTEASSGGFTRAHVLWDIDGSETGAKVAKLQAVSTQVGGSAEMGHVMGNAEVGYVDNRWVAIYGNGWKKPAAGTYRVPTLVIADLKSGEILHALTPYCAAGADGYGSPLTASLGNGLSTPTIILNSQRTAVETVYAGDLAGNLWRFDLSGTSDKWKNNKCGSTDPQIHKIARTSSAGVAALGTVQPIVSAPVVTKHPSGGNIVFFGTGRLMLLKDNLNTDVQAFYAVRDTQALRAAGNVATTANLHPVTISDEVVNGDSVARKITSTAFAWSDSKRGWYLNLQKGNVKKGERVLYAADVTAGQLLFTTTELSGGCGGTVTNRLYILDALTGGPSRILPQASLDAYGESSSGQKNCRVGGTCGGFVIDRGSPPNPLDIVLAARNRVNSIKPGETLELACPPGTRPRVTHGMVASCMVEGFSGFYQIQ